MVKHSIYFGMATEDLQHLRSRKTVEIFRLSKLPHSMWNESDLRRLAEQIYAIDAILESRRDQLGLDL